MTLAVNSNGDYGSGTDSQCIGGELGIMMLAHMTPNGDPDNNMLASNQLMKFDDEALEISTSRAPYVSGIPAGCYTILYGAKPDGTGWTDDAEMNATNEEGLKYYASLGDLPSNEVCVAVLLETRRPVDYMQNTSQWDGQWAIYFKVKMDTSIAGNVYQTVGSWSVWKRAEAAAVRDANNGEFPSRLNMVAGEEIIPTSAIHNEKKANYEKASYPDGVFTPGSGGEAQWGDSLYIVPYEAKISKNVEQFANSAETEEKVNYDLASQQYIADYILKPSLVFAQEITPPSSFTTTVTITDKLPAGLTYRTGSAVQGGNYQASAIPGQAGTVDGGDSFEPTITHNANGTQTLVWVIENQMAAEAISAIHYSCDIDMDSIAGTEYINTVNINTSEDSRLPKANYGNMDVATITVYAPAMLVARKKADALFVDAENPLGFNLQWSNRSVDPYRQQVFMDSMPFDSDHKGSSFGGDYSIQELTVTPPAGKSVSAFRCYYTLDETAANMKSNDFVYSDFTGSTCTSNGIEWIQAAIEADGTIPELVGVKPGAWLLLGDLLGSESLVAHITIEPSGNDAGDAYVNKISVGSIDLTVGRQIVAGESCKLKSVIVPAVFCVAGGCCLLYQAIPGFIVALFQPDSCRSG